MKVAVTRHTAGGYDYWHKPHEAGEWVTYEDYERLAVENEALREEIDQLRRRIACGDIDVDTYEAKEDGLVDYHNVADNLGIQINISVSDDGKHIVAKFSKHGKTYKTACSGQSLMTSGEFRAWVLDWLRHASNTFEIR